MTVERIELQDLARRVLGEAGLAADEQKLRPLIIELGWLLVSVPEELGGLGQGLPAACALYTELGRGLAGTDYLSSMLAIDAVCHGSLADREAWVERLTAGDYVAVPLADSTLAVTGSGAGKAKLTGLASAVPSADKAGHILVSASDGNHVALVPVAQPGVEITARQTWDTTRRLFDVRFSDVALDDALILASGPAAQKLDGRLSTHRDFALASDSIGGAEALLDMTVEYLKTRRQFGRPLALFQALKHRCADLKALIAASEALLLDSLDRLETLDETAELAGKKAKLLACTTYSKVAEEALQLHGGIGMTSEYPCHLFLKRALLNESLGDKDYDLDIGAAIVGGF